MKKIFAIGALICVTFFTGCPVESDSVDNNSVDDTPQKTILKITNASSFSLTGISWQGTTFSLLNPGQSSTKEFSVSTESTDLSGYIFLAKILGRNQTNLLLRTQEIITVPNGEVVTFTFLDNSIVVDMENIDNIQRLASIDDFVATITRI